MTVDQYLIPNLPLTISWTGNTNFIIRRMKNRVGKCDRVAQTYDRMDQLLFFRQFISLIFQPLSALVVSGRGATKSKRGL